MMSSSTSGTNKTKTDVIDIDWKAIFDKYDHDGNGHIDSTEFTFLVKDLLYVRDRQVFSFEDSISVAKKIAQHSAWATNDGISALITLDKFILGCTNGFLQAEYQITPEHFQALMGDMKGKQPIIISPHQTISSPASIIIIVLIIIAVLPSFSLSSSRSSSRSSS